MSSCKVNLAAAVGTGLVAAGCGGGSDGPGEINGADGGTEREFSLELSQLPVASSDDFDFAEASAVESMLQEQGPVVAFGSIPEGHDGQSEASLLLQFLDRDAEVRSGVSGMVVNVRDQTSETCDYEINIIPDGQSNDAVWEVAYDHVTNVTVTAGERVEAGQLLGNPGSAFWGSCDGPGRVELQVNNNAEVLAHCPLSFMSDAAAQSARTWLAEVMSDWNEATGVAVYDANELAAGGCATETTTP